MNERKWMERQLFVESRGVVYCVGFLNTCVVNWRKRGLYYILVNDSIHSCWCTQCDAYTGLEEKQQTDFDGN